MDEMKNNKIGLEVAFVCAALLSACAVQAAERIFPDAGGNLASTDAWGEDFPGVHDSVKLDKDGVYTAAADLEIEAMSVTANSVTLDFSGTPERRIVLNGDTGTAGAQAVFAAIGQGKTLAIKGGTWYSSTGKANFRMIAHSAMLRTQPSYLTISDGCVITNINRGLFLGLLDDSTVTMTGGSVIYSTGTFVGTDGGTARNTMHVCGGSRLHTGSHFYAFNNNACDCQFYLSDPGTTQTCLGSFYWEATTNCTYRISGGASGTFKEVRIGCKGGSGNRLEICNPETSFTSTKLNVGSDDNNSGIVSVSNSVVLANANTANSYGQLLIGNGTGAAGNVLIVSNCTVTGAVDCQIGKSEASGSGNGIVMKGDSAILYTGKILSVHTGAMFSFDVPRDGYSSIPLQFQKFTYTSSNVVFKVNARNYWQAHPAGGQIVLAKAGANTWIDTSVNQGHRYLLDAIEEMNKSSAHTHCTFSVVGKELLCDIGPKPGMLLLVR